MSPDDPETLPPEEDAPMEDEAEDLPVQDLDPDQLLADEDSGEDEPEDTSEEAPPEAQQTSPAETRVAEAPPETTEGLPATFQELIVQTTPYIWVTQVLMVVHIFVFALMLTDGVYFFKPTQKQLWSWGADYGPFVFGGHGWQIATGAFIHAGVVQLLVNLWCMLVLGRVAERLFGNIAYIFLYIFCFIGSALGNMILDPLSLSAGTAGALCGAFGGMIACAVFRKNVPAKVFLSTLIGLVPMIAWNFFLMSEGRINPTGSMLGGLVTGFMAGGCLSRRLPPVPTNTRYFLPIITVMVLLGATFYAQHRVTSFPNIHEHTPKGKKARELYEHAKKRLEHNDLFEAEYSLKEAIELNPKLTNAFLTRSWIYVRRGELDKAIKDATKALELDPSQHNAFYNRAGAHRKKLDFEKAIEDYTKFIDSRPPNHTDLTEAHFSRGYCYDRLGKYDLAISDYTRVIELDFQHLGAYKIRADARRKKKDYTGAIEDWEKAIDIAPALKTELDPKIQEAKNLLKKE